MSNQNEQQAKHHLFSKKPKQTTSKSGAISNEHFTNPFSKIPDSETSTLVGYDGHESLQERPDPDYSFHTPGERWNFAPDGKTSEAGSGNKQPLRHSSVAERDMFQVLMENTKGMSPEEVKEYLKSRNSSYNDGRKIMKGQKGAGYLQSTDGFGGAM